MPTSEVHKMAYCAGCGRYVGDYSAYHRVVPGKGEQLLCFRCSRWADRHPGNTSFPSQEMRFSPQAKRIRTFARIYIISSLGVFASGVALIVAGKTLGLGVLLILGGLSLFFFGLGMRKFLEK